MNYWEQDQVVSTASPVGNYWEQDAVVPADKGFMARMSDDFARRQQVEAESRLRNLKGDQSMLSTNLISLGQGLGTVADTGANAVGSLARYAWDVMPDYMKAFYKQFPEAAKELAATQTGQSALQTMGDAANQVKQLGAAHPTTRDLLSGAGNLFNMLPVGAASKMAGEGVEVLGDAAKATKNVIGDLAETSGANIAKSADTNYLADLIRPKETAKDLKKGTREVTQSLLGRRTYEPNISDKEVIEELAKIPKLVQTTGRLNSLTRDFIIVNKELNAANKGLDEALSNSKVRVPVQEFQAPLKAMRAKIDAAEGITEAERKLLYKPLEIMEEVTTRKSGVISPKELMEARRKLDSGLEIASGEKLTPAIEKVYHQGVKELRDYTNQFIDSKVPGTLESLKKQSALIRAKNQMAPKVKAEPETPMGRLIQKTPGSNILQKVGAPAGVTAAAVYTGTLPYVVGGTLVLGAGKALTSNMAKKLLGVTLTKSGKILKGGQEISPKGVAKLIEKKNLLKETEGMNKEQFEKFVEEQEKTK